MLQMRRRNSSWRQVLYRVWDTVLVCRTVAEKLAVLTIFIKVTRGIDYRVISFCCLWYAIDQDGAGNYCKRKKPASDYAWCFRRTA